MSVSAIIAFNQWLKWMYQCADDVLMVSREECVVKYMLARTDAFLEWSGLEIKDTKCAVLYERIGGNRWYRSKSDKCPVFTVATKPIQVYSLHETYASLGHLHLCIQQTLLSKATYIQAIHFFFCQYVCSLGIEHPQPLRC